MPAYTVLIVEDDVALVDELRDALRDQEVVARVAGDSAAAIELLKTQKFCGLVLDLVLDSGSGLDVLRHLNQNRIDLPAVVISAKLPDYVRELLVEDQVKLILAKPVDVRLLVTIVRGLCGLVP